MTMPPTRNRNLPLASSMLGLGYFENGSQTPENNPNIRRNGIAPDLTPPSDPRIQADAARQGRLWRWMTRRAGL